MRIRQSMSMVLAVVTVGDADILPAVVVQIGHQTAQLQSVDATPAILAVSPGDADAPVHEEVVVHDLQRTDAVAACSCPSTWSYGRRGWKGFASSTIRSGQPSLLRSFGISTHGAHGGMVTFGGKFIAVGAVLLVHPEAVGQEEIVGHVDIQETVQVVVGDGHTQPETDS